jgi:hypothetical protein
LEEIIPTGVGTITHEELVATSLVFINRLCTFSFWHTAGGGAWLIARLGVAGWAFASS